MGRELVLLLEENFFQPSEVKDVWETPNYNGLYTKSWTQNHIKRTTLYDILRTHNKTLFFTFIFTISVSCWTVSLLTVAWFSIFDFEMCFIITLSYNSGERSYDLFNISL